MSPAPVFVRIPGSHHPGTRLRLVPGFRDPGSVLLLGQVTQYGNPYLICITKVYTYSLNHANTFLFCKHVNVIGRTVKDDICNAYNSSVVFSYVILFDALTAAHHFKVYPNGQWRLKSPATRLLSDYLFRLTTNNTPNSVLMAFCDGNIPMDSSRKGSVMRKAFPCHVIVIWISKITFSHPLTSTYYNGN